MGKRKAVLCGNADFLKPTDVVNYREKIKVSEKNYNDDNFNSIMTNHINRFPFGDNL